MSKPPFRVKAVYEYLSEHDDDLSFPNGQIISVTEEEDADWYYGEYEDDTGGKHKGLFPRNFVKVYEPETPPRPSRLSRSRKDLESASLANETDEKDRSGPLPNPPPQLDPERVPKQESVAIGKLALENQSTSTEAVKTSEVPSSGPSTNIANKPPSVNTAKPDPLPGPENPVIGSFRDRINAFNKPAAPPVAPAKPGGLGSIGGSNFIKKPFVAPPPSKNAYVHLPPGPPLQKPYRREEDPEITGEISNVAAAEQSVGQTRMADTVVEEEDIPKPTSLKDRIALLQRQQIEQAARHSEAAQKKEKPKRPTKKHAESQDHIVTQGDQAENEGLERMNSGEASSKLSMDDDLSTGAIPNARHQKSRNATPLASPIIKVPREFLSDANDADQSGAGETEDGDELSTGRDDSDAKPRNKIVAPPRKPAQVSNLEADSGDEEIDAEEMDEEEEEEEELDPEVKRRMEIRERMAKMSGGMGMAGMFGPVGGAQQLPSKKQSSMSSERKSSGNGVPDPLASRAPPIPVMPMPGMQRVRTPDEVEHNPLENRKEETDVGNDSKAVIAERDPEEMRDIEDLAQESLPPTRRSTERVPPPVPHVGVALKSPANARDAPPLPFDRPVPPPRVPSQPLSPPPKQVMSPSEGSESDDELSLRAGSLSRKAPEDDSSRPTSHDGPVHLPSNVPPTLSRTQGFQSRLDDDDSSTPYVESKSLSHTGPGSPLNLTMRPSRVPPIPLSGPAIPSPHQLRAPPPPPPHGLPSPNTSTGESKSYSQASKSPVVQDSDEEITAYEGDYDTDIPPSGTRKETSRSHVRAPSWEHDTEADETAFHHSGLPSLGPPTSAMPRAVPPPPPSHPPRNARLSSDMPRAPPPPPPSKEQAHEVQNPNFDPHSQVVPRVNRSSDSRNNTLEGVATQMEHDPKNLHASSSSRREMPTTPQQSVPPYSPLTTLPAPSRTIPRQSLEVQRQSFGGRRSMDTPRLSSEQGFIAGDIDLGQDNRWWTEPNSVPPVLRNRRDLIYECEETSTTKRGGKQAMTKTLYVLYMDYSQTVISVHFETKDPGTANLEQRHEPPPTRLRQDQLEAAHTQFGSILGDEATSKKESVVGDGTPQALVSELISSLPDALPPVGVRAYGALVYANLANASIQQFDEIRTGDIITFRSAKFQGHHGSLVKSKYAIEVGKPDHVGIVVDWDGTKQKVRVWEQGRESKKVRAESFKLSDLRSGEVKVWRVMARNWVGWEGQS